MRIRSLAAITVTLLALLFGAPRAEAAQKPMRVAVLYFDNNTGDKKLDVLQKGFADMLITDLSQERSLAVVERDKLQALLGEMKLQRTRYFDKRTALRLGKGLGAQYVISGSFAAMKPQMRIDIRMIKIATSRVALASTVTGPQTQLFQLEQQLVKKFLAQLHLSPRLRSRSGTQGADVKTLLDYSKAIDLADKGKLRAAELWMSAVAKRAPRFALAKKRIRDFKARLQQAAVKREATIGQEGKALIESATRYIKSHRPDGKDQKAAKIYLAYRILLGYVPLRVLRGHLSTGSPALVKPGQQKKALSLMKAHAADRARLIKELEAYAKRHTRRYPNGMLHLDTYFRLPAADAARAGAASFKSSFSSSLSQLKIALARYLLLGRAEDGSGKSYTIAPPLGVANKRYAKLGFGLLSEVIAHEDANVKKNARARPYRAIQAREIYSEALLLVGRRDAGIAKLQEVLDTYPTARSYKSIERKIKKQLGLARDNSIREYKRYQKGLKGCVDMDLRVGLRQALYRRLRVRGIKAVSETVAEIEKACRKSASAQRFFKYLYSHAALKFGRHGYCKHFESWMKRYLNEGGSSRSVEAYRRNYTKCPVP